MVDVDAPSIAVPGGDDTIQSGRFPRGDRGRAIPARSGSAAGARHVVPSVGPSRPSARAALPAANRRVPDAAAWGSAGALSSVLQSPGAWPATACAALDMERPRRSVHAPSDRRWHSSRSDVARCNAHDRRSRWPCRGDGYSTRRVGIGMGSTTPARRQATPDSWCARLLLTPFSAGSTEVIIRFGCAIAVRSCIVASPAGTRPRGCVAGPRRKRAL
jgi:hypothetical protein